MRFSVRIRISSVVMAVFGLGLGTCVGAGHHSAGGEHAAAYFACAALLFATPLLFDVLAGPARSLRWGAAEAFCEAAICAGFMAVVGEPVSSIVAAGALPVAAWAFGVLRKVPVAAPPLRHYGPEDNPLCGDVPMRAAMRASAAASLDGVTCPRCRAILTVGRG